MEEAGFAGIGGKLYVSYEGQDDARFTEIWQGGNNSTRLAKIDHEEPLGKSEFEPRRARDSAGSSEAFAASMGRRNPRLRRAGFSPDRPISLHREQEAQHGASLGASTTGRRSLLP